TPSRGSPAPPGTPAAARRSRVRARSRARRARVRPGTWSRLGLRRGRCAKRWDPARAGDHLQRADHIVDGTQLTDLDLVERDPGDLLDLDREIEGIEAIELEILDEAGLRLHTI